MTQCSVMFVLPVGGCASFLSGYVCYTYDSIRSILNKSIISAQMSEWLAYCSAIIDLFSQTRVTISQEMSETSDIWVIQFSENVNKLCVGNKSDFIAMHARSFNPGKFHPGPV